ncbi:sterol desaturase family protein [Francisella sp. Scap27]|uniref:sterol desaturase family protein n=1 Tax=Francisella sp. Scap27 TaxID=2589986 RepID=UPI0015BAD1F0|nr:sterol desaturase family protein [Francisella sp. Scap27]QLE78673.1 sterol desaturase family protein [Francisella sp. Scap27]
MTEVTIRLIFFIGMLLIVATLELFLPKRKLQQKKSTRWLNNLLLIFINTILLRLIFPVAAVGVALFCELNKIGVLNYFEFAESLKIVIAFIVLDLSIYLQHVLFHHIPILWSIHKVHHADMDIDVTTGLRFHPFEMILSMLIKIVVVTIIGAPVLAVIIFEIVLNATAMFNHGNIGLTKNVDKILRVFIITPDMHRVHHSTVVGETNSNFGFNFSIWDRFFKTYKAQPSKGHYEMNIGLDEYKDARTTQSIKGMLEIPFKG